MAQHLQYDMVLKIRDSRLVIYPQRLTSLFACGIFII